MKQVSRAYTRLTKTIHPHLGGKFVEERASNVARIVIRAFQQAKRAAEFDAYFNAGKTWTSSYDDNFIVTWVLFYSEEELEEERELIKAQEAFEEADVMGGCGLFIFDGDQHHLIGHFDPKIMPPLFKYPAMARLFTAMAVGG